MPSTIPYDPSLALGNLVTQEKLDNLTQISALQAPVDAAEDTLNSFIALKRSIDMTVEELINMGIDTTDLITQSNAVGQQISQAAVAYAKAKLDAETKIQPLKAKIQGINDDVESPIDYNKTQTKSMPLSADSLKMNCQYFSFDENTQDSQTHASTVSDFCSHEVSYLGDSFSGQVKASAQSQMNSQHANHSIAGTLVVSVSCTHKDAVLLAPFILDVDKTVRVWNKIYPTDMIKPDSIASIQQIANQADTANEKSITLLSGATYGSCFIGMVHILNVTDTQASEDIYSIARSVQEQINVQEWFAHVSGGFGLDKSSSNDTKRLLSTNNISSHCSLITMGAIPSIKSNQVKFAVQGFSDDDGAKSMAALQKIQNATADDFQTIDSAANNARTGGQLIALQTAKVTAVLSGLAPIDEQSNQIIDINSVMTALDDYIQKCLAGNIGVPINYYLKPITKSQIAQMWVSKYYPGQYLAISGDDSGSNNSSSAPSSSAPPSSDSSSGNSGSSS